MQRSPNAMAAVGIGVSNLKRSVDFYTRVMGMKEMQTFKLPHMEEVVVGYEGRTAVVLMHYIDGSEQHYANNPVKLVFAVPDAKSLIDGIRKDGLEITREAEDYPGMGGTIIGLAKDPDGYVIELMQPVVAAQAKAEPVTA
jgi:lactoylglutathione lyase